MAWLRQQINGVVEIHFANFKNPETIAIYFIILCCFMLYLLKYFTSKHFICKLAHFKHFKALLFSDKGDYFLNGRLLCGY